MERPRTAVHHTIVVVDVEGFGDRRRTNPHQVGVRQGLYRAVRTAFDAAGVPWENCYHEDRGDAVFVLAPAGVPKSVFVGAVPYALSAAVREHNESRAAEQRIRLRMGIHAGEVNYDEHGVTSASLNLAFRLVDAQPLKAALVASPGVLALITSVWFFEDVVRHTPAANPDTYRQVRVKEKETSTVAWISLPDHPYPPDPGRLDAPPPAGQTAQQPRQLPAAMPSFTGRATELATLTAALDAMADRGATMVISALAGAGGIGKTWLAVQWARQNVDRFPDGQLFVDLRGFSPDDPLSAATAVRGFLDALGVDTALLPADPHAQLVRYRELLADKKILIVLDNAADTAHVTPLLPENSTCTVLVTSRRHLHGLVTRYGACHLNLDVLSDTEAHAMLTARLGSRRAAAQPDAVKQLLTYCGGFPLALSIVASYASTRPHLSMDTLANELHDLGIDAFDTDDPMASVRAVLSWSTTALSPNTRGRSGCWASHPAPTSACPPPPSSPVCRYAKLEPYCAALKKCHCSPRTFPGATGCTTSFATTPPRTAAWPLKTATPHYAESSISTCTQPMPLTDSCARSPGPLPSVIRGLAAVL